LDDGKFLVGAFDAEVAAGDHDGIGCRDDSEDVFDGELVLDLGDDFYIPSIVLIEEIAEGDDILGVADKGEGDPIDSCLESDEEIGGIFFGNGGKIDADPWEVDVAAIAQSAGGENATVKRGSVFFDNLEVNDAVIDEKFLAWGEVANEIGVVDGDGGGGSFGIDGEDEFIADGE
jgi:hypothetical protein